MRLWRLVKNEHAALDGQGAERYGARYSPPGRPVVNFASEPGLAVLVALRYLPQGREQWPKDFVLGWTEICAEPESIPATEDEAETRHWVSNWLECQRSLLAIIPSRVLPEANIVMMNPLHPDAADVAPLKLRRFDFDECLHRPPMLDRYDKDTDSQGN